MSLDKVLLAVGIVLIFSGLGVTGASIDNSLRPIKSLSDTQKKMNPHGTAGVIMGIVMMIIGGIVLIYVLTHPPAAG